MNEKQLAALVKKNAAKAEELMKLRTATKKYDQTAPTREETATDAERTQLFKEMKRREF